MPRWHIRTSRSTVRSTRPRRICSPTAHVFQSPAWRRASLVKPRTKTAPVGCLAAATRSRQDLMAAYPSVLAPPRLVSASWWGSRLRGPDFALLGRALSRGRSASKEVLPKVKVGALKPVLPRPGPEGRRREGGRQIEAANDGAAGNGGYGS